MREDKDKLEKTMDEIGKVLDKLYEIDCFLFNENLCERCINHKFAVYLEQQKFGKDYFIDCEYNKSHLNQKTSLKRVSSEKGNYIDIIVTKRDGSYKNDLICFEIKKWNNYKGRDKDRKNLKILTGGEHFSYDYGFYIILGKTRTGTKIEIYANGELINQDLNQN